ncbi:hypothetical protein [Qaidamihabitans albus]|uniref:hypothetical protein n=1 Tax=Qaidamihabitans albus TaxID=2795733 RepID=UPI0018F16889|nr:hypothetical protein [Qaidamihabitans albus]
MRQDTGRTDERFADLLCADDEWVHAEFDAIVAANFGQCATHAQVPLPPASTATSRAPRLRRTGAEPGRARGARTAAAREHWPRQRSPPALLDTQSHRE